MRELIPLPSNNMTDILLSVGPKGVTNVSNGYYGYQPHLQTNMSVNKQDIHQNQQRECEVSDMDVQFHNLEENIAQMQNSIPRQFNRKRRWVYSDDVVEFKKRRENDTIKFKECKVDKKILFVEKNVPTDLEELLLQTHGVAPYHWLCAEA